MLFRILIFVTFLAFASCSLEKQLFNLVLDRNGNPVVSRVRSKNPEKHLKVTEENVVVKALYQSSINETGWSFLELQSNEGYDDERQAYSAGYVEGVATHDVIYMHWFNTLGDFCQDTGPLCDYVEEYVEENSQWIEDSIAKHSEHADYWHQVNLFYDQMRGLADGYNHVNKDPATKLTYRDLLWLNLQGEFEDIAEAAHARRNNFKPDDLNKLGKVLGNGRCSALIKILPDGSDLLVAQDTWSSYGSMLRTQKKYNFNFHRRNGSLIPGSSMSFSSYPGVITSGDDFYVISSGLVTLETTIGNSNSSLWQYVKPTQQVLETVRSMVANRLAISGRSWSRTFSRYNSGTYNNQWMIVDYTKFKVGTTPENLPKEVLWVLEQIPRYIHAEDMTQVLRNQGYWPSYNVAAFKSIFNISGNLPLVEKFGDWFTYERNPRALIFKRDHGNVEDVNSMLSLMRYNDFRNDPLSKCACNPPYSAENAIAARCDLNPANGTYPFPALGHRSHGATDAKITSQSLLLDGLQFLSVSGPIHNDELGLPPFQWSKTDFQNVSHVGHPDLWKFPPLTHQWA